MKGVKIIECDEVVFSDKDLIWLKHKKDFEAMVAGLKADNVFRCRESIYLITDEFAYCYSEKTLDEWREDNGKSKEKKED